MAFPFLSENGFETGAIGHFDAQSPGTFTRADFAHYSKLAEFPGLPAPYSGAYCFRVNLKTNTTDHYLQETGAWDLNASASMFVRFMFWMGGAPVMANNDEFVIFQLWSSTNTPEASIVVNYTTANGYRLGIGESAGAQFLPLTLNAWHCIEAKFVIDSGVGNDGTIDAWLDGSAFTQVTALDQGVITSGVIGVVGQDAGTTAGVVLFDDIIADDTQIYPPNIRFPLTDVLTLSGHAFVGPGKINAARLLSGAATDNVLAIYDTDTGDTLDFSKCVLELKNTVNSQMVPSLNTKPIHVTRGCYVALSGTNPRAQIDIEPEVAYGSDGAIRRYGSRRTPTPRNA